MFVGTDGPVGDISSSRMGGWFVWSTLNGSGLTHALLRSIGGRWCGVKGHNSVKIILCHSCSCCLSTTHEACTTTSSPSFSFFGADDCCWCALNCLPFLLILFMGKVVRLFWSVLKLAELRHTHARRKETEELTVDKVDICSISTALVLENQCITALFIHLCFI